MKITASKVDLDDIQSFRKLFLVENNFQIRYNAYHERGWSDSYLLMVNDEKAGYGSVKGFDNRKDRDSIFEFFVIDKLRSHAEAIFLILIKSSSAKFVECQSNESLLTAMLYDFCENQYSDVVLFEDQDATSYRREDLIFRPLKKDDEIFEHTSEPIGEFVLEMKGQIVATGGYFTHYNFPFADLYMEVEKDHRRRGLATFLLQEIKKECYNSGHIPAARCNSSNNASKRVMIDVGMMISGCMLTGQIRDGHVAG